MSSQLPVIEREIHTQATPQYVAVNSGYEKNQADDEIDLRELLLVLRRRKGVILLFTLLIFLIGSLITLNIQPTYKSTTTIQIESEESAKVLSFDVGITGDSANSEFFQTQYELLQSRILAGKVIEDLGIDQEAVNNRDSSALSAATQYVKKLVTWNNEDKPVYELGKYPQEDKFLAGLSIAPVKKSQIVSISYEDNDPQFATDAANAVAENFIELTAERRKQASSDARRFIKNELKAAELELRRLERELTEYAREVELIQTGDENSQSLVSQRTAEVNRALAKAEATRIEAEASYRNLQSSQSTLNVLNSPTVQQLKQSLAQLQDEYQKNLKRYKPGYPDMVNLKRLINKANARLNLEITRVSKSSKNLLRDYYLAAKERESSLKAELETQKEDLLLQRDKGIQYGSLLRGVEIQQRVFKDLLLRSLEIKIASGAATSNIAVVDPAILPYAQLKPNIKLNLALSSVLGLFMGVVIAFLLEFMDDRIKSSDELKRLLGLPILGVTPEVKGKDPTTHALATAEQPTSALAESYRSLRTNLLFSSIEGVPKVLALTSAIPSEGKSSSCMNLATAFAQASNKVLVIDADMRKPTIHKRLKLDNSKGLSNFLTHQAEIDEVIQKTIIDGVSVVTAGPLSPNPSELLTSRRIEEIFNLAPEQFDLVILDCPPVMGLADALVLANKANATLLVSAFGQTSKRAIQDAHERLKQARANLIGTVFTKVKTGGGYGYSYEYSYHNYGIDKLKNEGERL